MGARKVKVPVFGTIGKSILIDPQATRGATLGTNVFTPDGVTGTPATVRAWLGLTTTAEDEAAGEGGGGVTHHRLLQGLTVGDDHPQYTRKDTLTTAGDLYVRGATAPERLGAGSNGEVLKIVGGVPAWATDERGVVSVVGTYDEIDVDDTDPAAPILSLAPDVLAALDLALTAVQPSDLDPITFLTETDETAVLVSSRRLVEGSNITFDVSTPGQLVINASGGGGGGTVEAVIGTPMEIDVDDYDPAFPVLSLAQEVLDSLDLADSAAQPGDNISIFTNDVPYLVAADIANFVPNSRQIISGAGLTGGGDLSADRTLAVGAGTGITVNADDVAVDINGLTQDATPDGAADFVMTYDASAGTLKKVLLDDLPGGGGGGTVDTIVAGDGILVDATDPANPEVSVDEAFAFDWSALHTFTNSTAAIRLDSVSPRLYFNESDAAADEGLWQWQANAGSLTLAAMNDAISSASTIFTVARGTGASITNLQFGNSGDDPTYEFAGTGSVLLNNDNQELRFGTGGDDLAIYHDGTNNQIDSNTGSLRIMDSGGTMRLTVGTTGVTIAQGSATVPSLQVGGNQAGLYSTGSNFLGITAGGTAIAQFIDNPITLRIAPTDDTTDDRVRMSFSTTAFAVERGYVGFPSNGSDTMFVQNAVGTVMLLRVASGASRIQIDDATGVRYVPVSYTGSFSQPEVGFRIVPQNIQNGSYGCVLGDSGCHLFKASGGAGETYTIPANGSVAYPIGTTLTFVNDGGGTLTIAITTDTLQMSPGGATGSRTLADNGVATALKVTSTKWIIWGTGLS